jgi:hypothetical protein
MRLALLVLRDIACPFILPAAMALALDWRGWKLFWRRHSFANSAYLLFIPHSWFLNAFLSCSVTIIMWGIVLCFVTPPYPLMSLNPTPFALVGIAIFSISAYQRRITTLRLGKGIIQFQRVSHHTCEVHVAPLPKFLPPFAQDWTEPIDKTPLSPALRRALLHLHKHTAVAVDAKNLSALLESGVRTLQILTVLLDAKQVDEQLRYCNSLLHGYFLQAHKGRMPLSASLMLLLFRPFTSSELLIRKFKLLSAYRAINQCIPLRNAICPMQYGFKVVLAEELSI